MEILDQEEQIPGTPGKNLAYIAGIAYVLGGLACMVGLYGTYLIASGMMTAGAPDATTLADGIRIAMTSWYVSIPALVLGIILQTLAFRNHSYAPAWLWKIMLFSGLAAILSGIVPFNPVSLIIGLVILAHVVGKRAFYFEN